MYHYHAPEEARLLVQLATFVLHQPESLKGVMSYWRNLENLQTHPEENVIDGVQLQSLGGEVQLSGQWAVHQKPTSSGIGRVVGLIVQGLRNVVLVVLLSDGLGLEENISSEQVLHILAGLQVFQDVLHTDEHVVVALEDVTDVAAVGGEPLQKVGLLQS